MAGVREPSIRATRRAFFGSLNHTRYEPCYVRSERRPTKTRLELKRDVRAGSSEVQSGFAESRPSCVEAEVENRGVRSIDSASVRGAALVRRLFRLGVCLVR